MSKYGIWNMDQVGFSIVKIFKPNQQQKDEQQESKCNETYNKSDMYPKTKSPQTRAL